MPTNENMKYIIELKIIAILEIKQIVFILHTWEHQ